MVWSAYQFVQHCSNFLCVKCYPIKAPAILVSWPPLPEQNQIRVVRGSQEQPFSSWVNIMISSVFPSAVGECYSPEPWNCVLPPEAEFLRQQHELDGSSDNTSHSARSCGSQQGFSLDFAAKLKICLTTKTIRETFFLMPRNWCHCFGYPMSPPASRQNPSECDKGLKCQFFPLAGTHIHNHWHSGKTWL